MVKLGGNLGNFSLKICQSMEFGLCTWESWVKIENLSTEVSRWEVGEGIRHFVNFDIVRQ